MAFELALQLQHQGYALPKAFIASGSRAPHLPSIKPNIAHLPQVEFVSELTKLNGTSNDILQHEELMALLLPMLRADFSIAESYLASQTPIACPIHVFSGRDDDITHDQLTAWQALTTEGAELNYLEGDHFFIDQYPEALLENVQRILIPLLLENQ
ncbi:thioesterase II family protein [Shewanella surugensis]|uniref:thioesterase II family protein n=1 Tax=Shewanella surugensis TaxID=212020 RepID=UPI00289BDD08|nr:thioesterase domain-containing protein [Shewanella surugensis]